MSAAVALQAAYAAGIQLRIDGDDLILRAPAPPPAPVIDILSRHKADVMRMLRPGEWHSPEGGWSVEEWLVFFDERAGVAEFDGGLPRPQAEVHAFACCVAEWLNQHPVGSPGTKAGKLAFAALANLGIAKPPDFPTAGKMVAQAADSDWTSRTAQGCGTLPTDLESSAYEKWPRSTP
jgi:hypothetical protein